MAAKDGLSGLSASLARVEGALKLRYMGIGFVWAWLYGAYYTPVILPNTEGLAINSDASWFASAVAVVTVFFLFGFWLRRTFRPRSWWVALAAATLAVGTVLTALGVWWGTAVSAIGGLATGVGYGLLSIFWAQALVAVDIDDLEVAIPLSALVVIPCVVTFPFLEGPVGVLAAASLPLVSGLLLLLCLRDCADASANDDGAPRGSAAAAVAIRRADRDDAAPLAWRYLIRVSALLCLVYVAVGWESALSVVDDAVHAALSLDLSTLLANAASLILAILFVFFSKRVSFAGLLRWIMPLAVVSLVLFVQVGNGSFYAALLASVCDVLAQILAFLFVVSLAKEGRVSAALGIGVVNGSLQLGVLLGNLLGVMAAGSSLTATALTCVLALAIIAIPQRDPSELSGDSGGGAVCQAASCCEVLRERYGLSEREAEIVELLAEGRTRPYIREKLFISNNTVATHIKHIYRKLDVHSKEELIDLVKSERAGA